MTRKLELSDKLMEITTWQEAAEAWKKGDFVWSVELGGIGPGYEQAIQVLLFEIMVRWQGSPLPLPNGDEYPADYNDHVDKVVHELNEACGGFSGAQVGAAKSTAFNFMSYGYKKMMDKLDKDRHILVSRRWVGVPEKTGGEGK